MDISRHLDYNSKSPHPGKYLDAVSISRSWTGKISMELNPPEETSLTMVVAGEKQYI